MKFKSFLTGFAIGLLPIAGLAAAPDTIGTAKTIWIQQVKMAVSVPVCKSFVSDEAIASQMNIRNINYDKCISLMPAITDQCLKKYDASLPPTINDESAEKWGRLIGECIGNNFAMSYLYSDADAKPIVLKDSFGG